MGTVVERFGLWTDDLVEMGVGGRPGPPARSRPGGRVMAGGGGEGAAFAAVLVELRRERGVSQYRLEREMGFAHGHLSRLESGGRSPTVATLAKLAAALRLGPAERRRLVEAAGYPLGGRTTVAEMRDGAGGAGPTRPTAARVVRAAPRLAGGGAG